MLCVFVSVTSFYVNWLFSFQATGEDYSVEPADTRRPFRALLDVGLIRTTTGNRVFGALKVIYYNTMLTGVIFLFINGKIE